MKRYAIQRRQENGSWCTIKVCGSEFAAESVLEAHFGPLYPDHDWRAVPYRASDDRIGARRMP